MTEEKIAGYTHKQFLDVATAIAKGHAPQICGRQFSWDQWFICDKLAELHQDHAIHTGNHESGARWQKYRDVVLRTRLL